MLTDLRCLQSRPHYSVYISCHLPLFMLHARGTCSLRNFNAHVLHGPETRSRTRYELRDFVGVLLRRNEQYMRSKLSSCDFGSGGKTACTRYAKPHISIKALSVDKILLLPTIQTTHVTVYERSSRETCKLIQDDPSAAKLWTLERTNFLQRQTEESRPNQRRSGWHPIKANAQPQTVASTGRCLRTNLDQRQCSGSSRTYTLRRHLVVTLLTVTSVSMFGFVLPVFLLPESKKRMTLPMTATVAVMPLVRALSVMIMTRSERSAGSDS